MFDSILFDLDGTLWDAVAQIAQSWNLVLTQEKVDRPPITTEELRPGMGMLLPDIAARLLPDLPRERQLSLIQQCCGMENEYLSSHSGTLYPGVPETLAALSQTHPLFIVSNCQAGYIEAFFSSTGLQPLFTGHECSGRTGRPKWENIASMVERYRLRRPVYIGDTLLDYQSAQAAGIPFLHAAYGFGQVDNVPSVTRFDQIPTALSAL